MNRALKEEELKDVYNVTNDTIVSVKSSALLGHLSLLGRHEQGNEERIEKLRNIVEKLGGTTRFVNKVNMPLMDLLEVYNLDKKIDYERAKEILQANQREKEADALMADILCQTKQLPDSEQIQKEIKQSLVLKILDKTYFLYISNKSYIIGRSPESDIFINEENVSRMHCKLYWEDDKWMVEDLSSTNGTFINDNKIQISRIKNGDSIKIGNVKGTFMNMLV